MELKQPGPSIELRVAILCPRDPRSSLRRLPFCIPHQRQCPSAWVRMWYSP